MTLTLQSLVLTNAATGNQTTEWIYGTTLSTSGVARSDLPVTKTYPTTEEEAQTYNRQGEVATLTDANGSVHQYDRDKLGRLRHDRITTLASGVDGLVRRISKTYDNRGQVACVTSADDESPSLGDAVNEVAYTYNGIGCLTADAQSHSGAVHGGTPKVQYQCSAAQNLRQRRTGIIYPDGRALNYEYGDEGSIDDVLNRVQSVHDDDLTVLAEFHYVGTAMPVLTKLPQPGVERRWKKLPGESDGAGGDPYSGYDQFGRTVQMHWYKVSGSPETYDPLVSAAWGYNRASLKLWRQDLLAPTLAAQDQLFAYDGLYQVTDRKRGVLDSGNTDIIGTPTQAEEFGYDETGNWVTYQQINAGVLDIDQTRGNNVSNQIAEINNSSAGVSYAPNGNMLLVPTTESLEGPSRQLVWDAWNRLRVVKEEGVAIVDYQYDGINRRILVLLSVGPTLVHDYFDDSWRKVENRLGDFSGSVEQWTWHPANRRELLLRDHVLADPARMYCLKDDMDPVAVCDSNGVVRERYAYSGFGVTNVLDDEFLPTSSSSFDWSFLFHGEFRDIETGWYNYGYRYYAAEVGRWLSRDPMPPASGGNLYMFVNNSPIDNVDLLGLYLEMLPILGTLEQSVNTYFDAYPGMKYWDYSPPYNECDNMDPLQCESDIDSQKMGFVLALISPNAVRAGIDTVVTIGAAYDVITAPIAAISAADGLISLGVGVKGYDKIDRAAEEAKEMYCRQREG